LHIETYIKVIYHPQKRQQLAGPSGSTRCKEMAGFAGTFGPVETRQAYSEGVDR